jgi:hypothetical protein
MTKSSGGSSAPSGVSASRAYLSSKTKDSRKGTTIVLGRTLLPRDNHQLSRPRELFLAISIGVTPRCGIGVGSMVSSCSEHLG